MGGWVKLLARRMDGLVDVELDILSGRVLRLERSTSRRMKGRSGIVDLFLVCEDASSMFLLFVDFCELSISGGLDGSQKLVVDT